MLTQIVFKARRQYETILLESEKENKALLDSASELLIDSHSPSFVKHCASATTGAIVFVYQCCCVCNKHKEGISYFALAYANANRFAAINGI